MRRRKWRSWPNPDGTYIDQIAQVIRQLKCNPHSRRLLVIAYNPSFADKTALPPCHTSFQFYVADDRLSCQMYQRSADLFLGVPFNIASYALLTLMTAQVCALQPGEFIHALGDAHLYQNHIDQAELQLTRAPHPLPRMQIDPAITDIFDFRYEHFELVDYRCHPAIRAEVAV